MKSLQLIALLAFPLTSNAQHEPPKTLVNTQFTFDTTATYTIYLQKYYRAGTYFILTKNVGPLQRQKLHGKEVEVSGTLSLIQGKTLVLDNKHMEPSKDNFSIIDTPNIKLASQEDSLELPAIPPRDED